MQVLIFLFVDSILCLIRNPTLRLILVLEGIVWWWRVETLTYNLEPIVSGWRQRGDGRATYSGLSVHNILCSLFSLSLKNANDMSKLC